MATKLLRLVNDKKRAAAVASGNLAEGSSKRMRDIDSEEEIAQLKSKIDELVLLNNKLKENVKF